MRWRKAPHLSRMVEGTGCVGEDGTARLEVRWRMMTTLPLEDSPVGMTGMKSTSR